MRFWKCEGLVVQLVKAVGTVIVKRKQQRNLGATVREHDDIFPVHHQVVAPLNAAPIATSTFLPDVAEEASSHSGPGLRHEVVAPLNAAPIATPTILPAVAEEASSHSGPVLRHEVMAPLNAAPIATSTILPAVAEEASSHSGPVLRHEVVAPLNEAPIATSTIFPAVAEEASSHSGPVLRHEVVAPSNAAPIATSTIHAVSDASGSGTVSQEDVVQDLADTQPDSPASPKIPNMFAKMKPIEVRVKPSVVKASPKLLAIKEKPAASHGRFQLATPHPILKRITLKYKNKCVQYMFAELKCIKSVQNHLQNSIYKPGPRPIPHLNLSIHLVGPHQHSN